MAAVRISVGLPQVLGGEPPSLLTRYAARAEEAGFDGLWTIDNAAGGPTAAQSVLDAVHALTFVAPATTRVRLGTAVLVLPRRQPVLLAKELATLDHLSGGRVIAGVGVGRDDGTVAPLGFPTDRRVRRVVEAVAVMRAVWTQSPATHEGELWSFTDAHVGPRPVQTPHPPVWFGAGAPASLRRVARHADGWIGAGASTAEQFAEQVALLDDALGAEGRDPATFPHAKRVYVAVEPTRARALERLQVALADLYGWADLAERVGLAGPPAACAEALLALVAAGADELVLSPAYDYERQLEALYEVADAVRAAR